MEKLNEIIKVLMEIGVPKETTVKILNELVDHPEKYIDQTGIENLLYENLDINQLISLKSYFKI